MDESRKGRQIDKDCLELAKMLQMALGLSAEGFEKAKAVMIQPVTDPDELDFLNLFFTIADRKRKESSTAII